MGRVILFTLRKENTMEQWKVVEGTHGALEVSSLGRVKSNLRDGRILKTQPDRKGYQRLRMTIKRERYSFKLHRLVAQAFIPNPENKPQVNHIDGNKSNNAASNLEWVSNKENAHHAIENDLWENVYAASIKTNTARMKPVVATSISTGEKLYFESVSAAEKVIGSRHIVDVIKGKRCQAKGYTFAYKEGGDTDD